MPSFQGSLILDAGRKLALLQQPGSPPLPMISDMSDSCDYTVSQLVAAYNFFKKNYQANQPLTIQGHACAPDTGGARILHVAQVTP